MPPMDAEQIWAEKPDEDLVEAGEAIWEFTEAGERIIRAELRRRGLPEPPPPIAHCCACGRAIHEGDPLDACAQCGQAFSDDILAKLDAAATAPGEEAGEDAAPTDDTETIPPAAEGWESEAEADYVYRSRLLHEVETVCEHLEQEDLPFTRSEESADVRYPMPVAAAPATLSGVWYLVTVPAEHAARAAEIVDALAVSNGDDEGSRTED
jgi:hypothetical protein